MKTNSFHGFAGPVVVAPILPAFYDSHSFRGVYLSNLDVNAAFASGGKGDTVTLREDASELQFGVPHHVSHQLFVCQDVCRVFAYISQHDGEEHASDYIAELVGGFFLITFIK